jgi:DNA polymerase-3 subunit gamma/tau
MLADLPASDIKSLTEQVQGVSTAFIDQIFSLLFDAESSVRYASQPRLAIEMVFFKIQQIAPALPIDLLIERLDSLVHDQVQDPNPTRDPIPRATVGVVEIQSSYGEVRTPSPVDPHGQSIAGEDYGAVNDSPGERPPNDPHGPEPDAHGSGDDSWSRTIALIAETKPSVGAALSRSQLVAVSDKAFKVAVHDNDYSMNLVKKNLALIEAICRDHAGREIQVDFLGHDTDEKNAPSARQKADDIKRKLLNHPLVGDVVDIFSGKIEEIKIR